MNQRFFLFILSIALTITASGQKNLNQLQQTYREALSAWEVPGMAIAIIKNDSLILSEGFGIRNTDTQQPVDENTLFAIASNTKAFTATAIGILVEEGKMGWNDRVTDHLPWFEMYAPYVTSNMTVRDLLSHRSGLKTFSGDLLWYGSNYSRKEVVKRAKHLEPAYGFRERFGYSNVMYLTAGLVVEAVSGQTWDDFIRTRFFEPLQMKRSITSTKQLENMQNVAAPHNKTEKGVIPIDYLNWDNIAPAGSIISCVHDLSHWVKANLHNGVFGEDTVFSAKTTHELWKQHTPLPVSSYSKSLWPSTHLKSYGMGWSMYDYSGKKIVTHNGGYDGMISQTVLIPEEKSGFILLTNSLSGMYSPMVYETLDFLLEKVPNRDWNEYFLNRNQQYEQMLASRQQRADSLREKGTSPSLPLEKYTGTYSGDLYGDVEITLEEGILQINMKPSPKFHSALKHWHYDTFEIKFKAFPSLPRGWVSFILNRHGEVSELRIDVPNPDFDFTELKLYRQ